MHPKITKIQKYSNLFGHVYNNNNNLQIVDTNNDYVMINWVVYTEVATAHERKWEVHPPNIPRPLFAAGLLRI